MTYFPCQNKILYNSLAVKVKYSQYYLFLFFSEAHHHGHLLFKVAYNIRMHFADAHSLH